MERLAIFSHNSFRAIGFNKSRSPSSPYGPASQGSQLITLVCTVHTLLASPAPSSATPPQLLLWSLQDDQDVSLHTCHVLKRSRWEIYQLVHSNRGNCLD